MVGNGSSGKLSQSILGYAKDPHDHEQLGNLVKKEKA